MFTAYGKSVTVSILYFSFTKPFSQVDVDGAPFVKFVYRDGDDPIDVDAITVVGDVLLHRFEHKG